MNDNVTVRLIFPFILFLLVLVPGIRHCFRSKVLVSISLANSVGPDEVLSAVV